MTHDEQKLLARTPAERIRAMRQRKRDAGLISVDLPRGVALRVRLVGFDVWLAEVQSPSARSAGKLDTSPPIEKGRIEMTRQGKTALRIDRAVMAAEGWREVVAQI